MLVTTFLVITSASAMMFTDDAEAVDSEQEVSTNREISFTGTVRFPTTPPVGQEPNIIVLIAKKVVDPTDNTDKMVYVVAPSKVKVNSNGSFTLPSYRILDAGIGLEYYFLIESGYEIEITGSSLEGTSKEIYRDNNNESLRQYPGMYVAYRLMDPVNPADTVIPISGKNGDKDKIGAIHVTGTLTVNVTSDDYKLSNVIIHLVREGETDSNNYSFEGITGNDGSCTIKEVSTGTYNVIAILEDYDQIRPMQVTILKGETSTLSIEMELSIQEGKYWGYDLPHFLMLCAGGAGVVLLAISTILQYRTTKGQAENWFLNDVKDESEEEGSEDDTSDKKD